ncbi:prepilin-type N-terminal cleavage/methylation domain-containing protein [Pseudoalteromonas sp. SG45-5]|uniref:PulJ/GspJ family protein n=1 Tax=unclassified Pseudoalteromonas TaxID=194690 RepID=UPI0015FC253E|nr:MULTISPECIES: prepilin-type N-terminal cleavage/methylation domain-containing protein [unclassified Pseudoalteromonas]MBB1386215.1 prepilin-type N-terminal cleavage/methylation domain-containing protein [Pseudoalteromonas sp. SG45-5]MBB1394130.1 prepilin-type N-terminal cleavage/methylation domain-containing protein [Pseudoalteromonas sp. SG44-4]MBB1448982.1 prepilin-type N-terminal cleavage/methylation domain-containing protein [Pseudoalteromonas sp. SG41-6]
MHKQQGFTLIELLISVTLLSLLMFTGNYVYMQLASRWDKELGSFEQNAAQTRAVYLLQNTIDGIEPYLIKNKKGRPEMFFVGGTDSLLAITKRGLIDTQNPEIFRLTAVQNPNGKYNLVYQAISGSELLLINSEQNIEFTQQKTLLTNLDEVNISYLGWKSLDEMAMQTPGVVPTWQTSYSGLDQQLTPQKIKIILVKNQQVLAFYSQLDKESNSWFSNYIQTGDF